MGGETEAINWNDAELGSLEAGSVNVTEIIPVAENLKIMAGKVFQRSIPTA